MRFFRPSLLFVVAVLGALGFLCVELTFENKKHFIKEIDAYTETGDIIFRTGNGFWSPYFGLLDDKNGFSHAGMLLKTSKGSWFVVHAEANDDGSDGFVKKTPLDEFIADSKKFEIKKNTMTASKKNIFISSILKHLSNKTPFDNSFEINDEGSKVYCTELIWLAARIAGIYDFGSAVKISGREFITVDSIYHSSFLLDTSQ